MKKRILPFLLAAALCLSFLPATTALAAEPAVTVTKTNIQADSLFNTEGYASLSLYSDGTTAPQYALMDSTGKLVFDYGKFPCQYDLYDGIFVNGIVQSRSEWGSASGVYTLFDLSGKQVASDTYDFLTFHEGYGLAFKGEYGDEDGTSMDRFVIDATGKRILTLPKVFNVARGFGGGDWEFERQIWGVSYFGYVGGYGEGLMWIFTPREFKNISEFNSVDPASVTSEERYEAQYTGGYIDLQGNLVIDRKFYTTYPFIEGLAKVQVEDGYDKYGFIDKTGSFAIQPQFDAAGSFNEGYAAVANGLKYGYIDKTGKTVIPMEYDMAYGHGDGLFSVGIVSGTSTDEWGNDHTYKHGFIDITGKVIVPLEYDDVSHFVNGTAYAIKDKTVYILTLGEVQDVPSDWAEKEVTAAIEAGLVPEALQAKYTSPVSRGAVAEMFVNLLEKSTGKTIDEILKEKDVTIDENAFTDTKDKAVLAANALGIINGVGDGKFDPNGLFTRAQIAAIINRVAGVMGVETEGFEHSFTDLDGHWADAELGWPVHAEIINGVGDGKFDPEGSLTTEQAILITYRALNALGK